MKDRIILAIIIAIPTICFGTAAAILFDIPSALTRIFKAV